MSLSLGALILPASILGLILRLKGPAQKFIAAGAVSPETARRPGSLGIQAEYLLEPLLRSGILLDAGDGRYYANAPRIRRRAMILYGVCGAMALAGAAFIAAAWWTRRGA